MPMSERNVPYEPIGGSASLRPASDLCNYGAKPWLHAAALPDLRRRSR
jgi:hypothetical protein